MDNTGGGGGHEHHLDDLWAKGVFAATMTERIAMVEREPDQQPEAHEPASEGARKELARTPWKPDSERQAMEAGMCGARTRTGGTCTNRKGKKTDHLGYGRCAFHCGSTPNGNQAVEQERVMSEIAHLFAAERIECNDPLEGLAEAERRARTMGRVLEKTASELERWWGPNHLGDAVPHVAVDLLGQWTDKSARISKLAIDAGLDERRVKLAERQGEMLAQVLRGFLESLQSALVAAGAPESLVCQVWSNEVPGIVRLALQQASEEDVS